MKSIDVSFRFSLTHCTLAAVIPFIFTILFLSFPLPANATDATQTLTAISDNFLKKDSRNTNKGDYSLLKTDETNKSHMLVRFDQSAIAALSGRTLVSASLQLYIVQNWGGFTTSGREVDVYRMTGEYGDWTELGSTWNCSVDTAPTNGNQDCATAAQWSGGTYAATAADHHKWYDSTVGWQSFDVTADVSSFLSGTTNYGWLVRKLDTFATGSVDIASKEYSDSSKKPKLVLTIEDISCVIDGFPIPSPNEYGWNNTNVAVSFTCNDPDGVAFCTSSPQTISAEGSNSCIPTQCGDDSGNIYNSTYCRNIDKTEPNLTIVSKIPEPNSNGWNNTDVSIQYQASDGLSGLISYPSDEEVIGEGEELLISKTVEDHAGNTRTLSTSVSIDKTAPTAAITNLSENEILDTCTPTIEGTTLECLSGVREVYCNGDSASFAVGTFTCQTPMNEGSNTLTIEAHDAADNIGTALINVTNPIPAGLTITSVIPEVIQINENTTVFIFGDKFGENTHVYVDDSEVDISVVSANEIVTELNFTTEGTHTLEIRNQSICPEETLLASPGLVSIETGNILVYRALIAPEEIINTSIVPVNIYANSGSFEPDTTISFAPSGAGCISQPHDLAAAQSVTYLEDNHLQVIVPNLVTGTYDVVVSNPNLADLCLHDGFQIGYSPNEQEAIQIAENDLPSRKSQLGLNENYSFQRNTTGEVEDSSHVVFDQYYMGIKVLDGTLISDVDNASNIVSGITDELKYNINISTTPVLTSQQVLAISDALIAPQNGYSFPPTAQLTIYQNQANQYVLAYDVHSEADNDSDNFAGDLIIDASTGALLNIRRSIFDSSCPSGLPSCEGNKCFGKGLGKLQGCVLVFTTKDPSGIYTLHNAKGNAVLYQEQGFHLYTDNATNCNNDNVWGNSSSYSGPDEVPWTTSPAGQTDAVDASYALQKAIDYFKDILGFGEPGTVDVVVHFVQLGGGGEDQIFKYGASGMIAVWDDKNKRIVLSSNLPGLDLVAHEFAHRVHLHYPADNGKSKLSATDCRPDGKCYGETGGLAEATADIFGSMAEYYAKTPDNGGDWRFGDHITNFPYRDMNKPHTYSNMTNVEVHDAALPADYFFYRLVTAFGNNDSGRAAASKIWYRALFYMGPATKYAAARSASVRAAQELAEKNVVPSSAKTKVQQAWSDAGVPLQPGE